MRGPGIQKGTVQNRSNQWVVDRFQTETSGKFDSRRKVSRWNLTTTTITEFGASGLFSATTTTFATANITTIRPTITNPNSKYGNRPTAAARSTTVCPTIAKLHTISANVSTCHYVSAVPADALIWESNKLQSITGRQRVSTAREKGLSNSIKLTQSII